MNSAKCKVHSDKSKNLTSHFSLITSHFKVKRGFTLIELLIVISILGILVSLTLVSYGSAQERGRDSKRKTDLDAIKKALELAKNDTAGAYYYSNTLATLGPTYIAKVPTDPKTAASYVYNATPDSPDCTATATCTSYTLTACLENRSDSQKDAVENETACPGTPVSYTITPN